MKRHTIDSVHITHLSVIMLSHVTPYKIKKKFIFYGSILLMLGKCDSLWFSRSSH